MKHTELPAQSHRITVLSGHSNYTFIHFTDAPQFLYCRSIAYCLVFLPHFVRIHRSCAVNPDWISQVRGAKTPRMEVLVQKQWLPVSRRRKQDVIEQLQLSYQPQLLPGLPIPVQFKRIAALPGHIPSGYYPKPIPTPG